MQQEEALEFYERVTQGTDDYETISLEHQSGATLEDVRLYTVDKQKLASVIERLPDELFEAAQEASDEEEAQELAEEQQSAGGISEDSVAAFEDLLSNSLEHDDLAPPQMRDVIEALNFETLFQIGSKVIEESVENTGGIKDFHEQT